MDRLGWAAPSSGLNGGLILVSLLFGLVSARLDSRQCAPCLPRRLHPLFNPCDQALLSFEVFVPLLPEPRQVRAVPHRDRELREIGDLLPQLRELVVHVVSLQRVPP
jgi:hypothetical protein